MKTEDLMIISNPYKENQRVIRYVKQDSLRTPIVDAIAEQLKTLFGKNILHSLKHSINAGIYCGCHAILCSQIKKKESCLKRIFGQKEKNKNHGFFFFQPVITIFKLILERSVKSLVFCVGKHGIVVHKCLFAKELSLPWNPLGGSKAA